MRKLIILIALMQIGVIVWAFEADLSAMPRMSLSEAKATALQHNSSYLAKDASARAAKWGKSNAMASMLPSVSLGGNWLYLDPATTIQAGNNTLTMNNDLRTISLNLSQPLYVGGKLYQAYKIAGTSAEMAELSLQAQRFTLLSEVESKYLAVLQLYSVYKISQAEIKSAQDNISIAKLKLDNGLISQADYLRVQSSLAGKEVSGLQAYTALQMALQDFANYLGLEHFAMPEELDLDAEQQMINRLSEYDLSATRELGDKALQVALKQNLSIKVLDKSAELSERAYRIAKGSFLPTVMLTGSRQYKENGFDRYKFTPSNQILLSVSVPLLPGLGNYASVQKAKEEARKVALENLVAMDGIKLGLEAATLNWISSARQIESTRLALSYNEQLYEQLHQRYQLDLLSVKDVLDAELMLSAARLAYNNALFGYLKTRSALMQSLALEDPAELTSLLDN